MSDWMSRADPAGLLRRAAAVEQRAAPLRGHVGRRAGRRPARRECLHARGPAGRMPAAAGTLQRPAGAAGRPCPAGRDGPDRQDISAELVVGTAWSSSHLRLLVPLRPGRLGRPEMDQADLAPADLALGSRVARARGLGDRRGRPASSSDTPDQLIQAAGRRRSGNRSPTWPRIRAPYYQVNGAEIGNVPGIAAGLRRDPRRHRRNAGRAGPLLDRGGHPTAGSRSR